MARRLLLHHAVCAASVAHAVVRPVGLPRLSRLAHALHHLLEPLPPTTSLLSASSLDELTNAAAPRAEGEIKLFAARPAAGIVPDGQPLPVLCLLHEFWGLSPSICEKAQGLADELGCLVVAPDTFRGVTYIPRHLFQPRHFIKQHTTSYIPRHLSHHNPYYIPHHLFIPQPL